MVSGDNDMLKDIQFMNLRQLRINQIHPGNIGGVHAAMKTAKKLEKIQINIERNDVGRTARLQLIEDILAKCK